MEGNNPLKSTVQSVIEKGDVKELSRILSNGEIAGGIKDNDLLLHAAVNAPNNCWLMVRMLIKAGVSVSTTNQAGATALHLAADKGHFKCARELLESGAEVNQKDGDGCLPLHCAARNRSGDGLKILPYLIKSGSSVNTPEKCGYTPLHIAALASNAEAVKVLLKAGGSHGLANDKGQTPLHLTCTPTVAQVLLNAGAHGRARDQDGHTAVETAIKEHPTVVKKLLDFGTAVKGEPHDSNLRIYFHLDIIKGDKTEVSLLQDIVNQGHYDFLKHPLCETFIHLKWLLVNKFFYVKLVIYASLVLILTAGAYIRKICKYKIGGQVSSSCSSELQISLNILNTFALIELVILLVFYVIQMMVLKRHFFRQKKKAIEVIFITCTLILLKLDWVQDTCKLHAWVPILLGGWCYMVVLLGHMPSVGIYIQMFKQVSVRMLTFACVYSSLFIGFSVSFYLVFEGEVFSTIWMSVLKTLAMMVGELEVSSILGKDTEQTLPGTAHVIFVLFVLLMTIVITNLLVGLAVQDIQMLQKEAGVSRLALTVEQETSVDIMLSSRLVSWIMPYQLHTWLRNKCSLLHHLPQRSLHVPNACNQISDSDASVDWWIRQGTRSQQRGPMEHYNIFIRPYDPAKPGKVYFSNVTKLIPTSYTLPDWIVRNTKLLIENGLHNRESGADLVTDDGEEEAEDTDTTNEIQSTTLENMQEQLNELQKSVTVMSQMMKKILNSK
ncbi:transient receptor potential channel pyrexia-like isoform X3 [Macrobrachium nipponense]|uniref:transient receptor potential channel pyrexia-like isoform X3 n=1 Tax=Macrobrachium nipponense TaxID=159736 RepID=UPI0030C85C19